MENKHILFVFRSLGTGGAQKVQAFVANACVEKGYQVTIISMSKEHCTLDIDKKIKILTLDYDRVIKKGNSKYKIFLNKMSYLKDFRDLCVKLEPDLVCSFLSDIVRLTVLALNKTNIPILGSERADPGQFNEKKIKQYNKAFNKCKGIVFQLQSAADAYTIKENVLTKVIPNPAIKRNNEQIMSRAIEYQNDAKTIFSGGRLTKQKRFDLLIEAFALVKKEHPEYVLKLYGDGPEMEKLVNLVDKLNLKESVTFLGDVSNIFFDSNKNDIFVLTSDFEGIPNVITEALLEGIPCISTDCSPGGARLLLDNGKAGDIVEVGNIKQLSSSIIKYIKNPEYVAKKVNYGKQYIKKFAPNKIKQEWIDIIERILNDE
ncbi:glycosyltransferase [Enterococcus casseliflavus]|uniref:glycosyltransferase n=1 Tax=Enterococcus casseliflavus TaxID=37734 RepID=UPI003D11C3D0